MLSSLNEWLVVVELLDPRVLKCVPHGMHNSFSHIAEEESGSEQVQKESVKKVGKEIDSFL